MYEIGSSDAKEKIQKILEILKLITRDDEVGGGNTCSLDRVTLYQGGLVYFAEGCNDNPRLFLFLALALLSKGLQKSAMTTLLDFIPCDYGAPASPVVLEGLPVATAAAKKTRDIYDSPTPPSYWEELLLGVDAQIILKVEDNDMDGAIQTMHRRVDVVSNWIGNTSELANDLYRLGCFYSLTGHNEPCAKYLQESLHIGMGLDEHLDGRPTQSHTRIRLDCIKLLAVTFDKIGDQHKAIREYERALAVEEDIIDQAKLMHALCHLLIQAGGQSRLAVDYLDNSINILQKEAKNETTDARQALVLDSMILYGNAMSAEKSFSEAIDWYNSVLRSNPDKSSFCPTNLRASLNKGN